MGLGIKYLNNIDLSNNQLLNFRLHIGDPGSSIPSHSGKLIYNSTHKKLQYSYLNSSNTLAWTNIASESFANNAAKTEVDNLFDKDISNNRTTIQSRYLPSYVDDVIEIESSPKEVKVTSGGKTTTYLQGYDDQADAKPGESTLPKFPKIGSASRIYVDIKENRSYRWLKGSNGIEPYYVLIATDLTLGNTETTAFRGDYGYRLTTFFDNWSTAIANNDVIGVAKRAKADANGLDIATYYFNKGVSINNSNKQDVYNLTNFHNTVTFKNTTSFEKLVSIGSEGIQFGGSSGVKITGNGTSLNINKSTIISGDLTVKDTNGKITSKLLSVEGQANLGSLIVSGETKLNGKTTIIGTASFSELSTFEKGLTANKLATFDGTEGIKIGDILINSSNSILNVSTGATFRGNITASKGTFSGGLDVTGTSLFNSSINIGTSTNSVQLSYANNFLSINKNTKFAGTLKAGTTTLSSLSVTNNATVEGALGVTGQSTFGNTAFFKSKYTAPTAPESIGSYEYGGIKIGTSTSVNEKDFTSDNHNCSFISWDETNHALRIVGNVYATGQVSAGGIGEGGSSGGSVFHSPWSDYVQNTHGTWALGADLGKIMHDDIEQAKIDISNLKKNGASKITYEGTGNFVTNVSKATDSNEIKVTRGNALVSGDIKNITIKNGEASAPGTINVLNNSNTITIPSKISDLSNDITDNVKFPRISTGNITAKVGDVIFTHKLGTANVIVSLYEKTTGIQVFTDIKVDETNVTVNFGLGASGDYTIVVVG